MEAAGGFEEGCYAASMENSKIQWTDHTFNPWTGCTRVSPGCVNCYAEAWSKRSGIVEWGPGKPRRRTGKALWNQVRRWNGAADPKLQTIFGDAARRPRVFCASLADWLDEEVPIEWLKDLLVLIEECPHLDFLLLTKRPQNFAGRVGEVAHNWQSSCESAAWWMRGMPPRNVWIGTTVEDQTRADLRIPQLLQIPADVRFLSCEPLLGPVVLGLTGYSYDSQFGRCFIDWIITGGESGPGARPFEVEWARGLRDQARAAGVAFFMKQLGGVSKHRGELTDFPEDLRVREFPTRPVVNSDPN